MGRSKVLWVGGEPGRSTLVSGKEQGTNVEHATDQCCIGFDRLTDRMVHPVLSLIHCIIRYIAEKTSIGTTPFTKEIYLRIALYTEVYFFCYIGALSQ